MSHVAAIVVAAGRGLRAGGERPKQYRTIGGRSVLAHALGVFVRHPAVARTLVVINPTDAGHYREACAELGWEDPRDAPPYVAGGDSRQASVLAGLEAIAASGALPDFVLIHDAARPFVDADLIDRAIAAAAAHGAAVPGVGVTDTVKVVDAGNTVRATPDRAQLRLIQTPQAFAFQPILAAHRLAAAAGRSDFTDDGAIAEWAGQPVHVFTGDPKNMKLTTPADFGEAERRLANHPALVVRVGSGYDVHAFGPGHHIWVGGLDVPHTQGVVAHSDGDVVLHALTDAVLGAMADGDIGSHFPPSDPQWKDASSDRFLAYAVERLHRRGGHLDHLDVTVICELPKIGPLREAMRARIANIAGIAVDAVSVKATTSERLGFTGRREGIAAMATATVRLPATGGSAA